MFKVIIPEDLPDKTDSQMMSEIRSRLGQGFVYMHSSHYKVIFKKRFIDSNYLPHKRGIIKITCIDKSRNRRTVHRMYYSGGITGLTGNKILVDTETKRIIGSSEKEVNVTVSEGSRFFYYWNHPDHHNRVAFKLATVFGIVSLISFALSIVGIIF